MPHLQTIEEFDDVEVVVPGRPSAKVNRKRDRAEKLFLHYIQRWAKDYLRRRLDWMVEDMYGRQEYASNTNPRHIRSALCPCQVRLYFMYITPRLLRLFGFQTINENKICS